MALQPFSFRETINPFWTIQSWSTAKNARIFADDILVHASTSHYSDTFKDINSDYNEDDFLVGTAQHVAAFIEEYEREWGADAIPVIKKIYQRVHHFKCYVAEDRREEVQVSVLKIQILMKHISDNLDLNLSEVFPALRKNVWDIVFDYDDSRSIRELSTLAAQGIIHAKSKEIFAEMDNFRAAFMSSSNDAARLSSLDFLFRTFQYNLFEIVSIIKNLNQDFNTQRVVTKFYLEHAPGMRISCLYVPKSKCKLHILEKFKASSIVTDEHTQEKLIKLTNMNSFLAPLRCSKKNLRSFFQNRRLKVLEICNQKLNNKFIVGAFNTNLVVLTILSPLLRIDVLPILAKSFPNLKILFINLPIIKDQVKEASGFFAKFASLQSLILYNTTSGTSKNLMDQIATLSMPRLKHLGVFVDLRLNENLDPTHFPKDRFPNFVESHIRTASVFPPLHYYTILKEKLFNEKPSEEIESKREEKKYEYDSKEDSEEIEHVAPAIVHDPLD